MTLINVLKYMALNVTKTGITGRNKLKGNIKACFGSNPIKNPKKSQNQGVGIRKIDKNAYFSTKIALGY